MGWQALPLRSHRVASCRLALGRAGERQGLSSLAPSPFPGVNAGRAPGPNTAAEGLKGEVGPGAEQPERPLIQGPALGTPAAVSSFPGSSHPGGETQDVSEAACQVIMEDQFSQLS